MIGFKILKSNFKTFQRLKIEEENKQKFAGTKLDKPKPSTRPAQPMSSAAATLVPYPIPADEAEPKPPNPDPQPEMTNTHCPVCDVYFCGEIPAKERDPKRNEERHLSAIFMSRFRVPRKATLCGAETRKKAEKLRGKSVQGARSTGRHEIETCGSARRV